ncbi:MAG TPA: hemerythrin domain-containing protein [Chloroflexota bacterium]|nr:hemerythrin domain-containing protein [Chloroflexota bacterium]
MSVENPSVSTVLRDEHAAISTVLGYLDRACNALEQGRQVDPGIFRDMLKFFTLFVGQCHHGKEEQILFPLLRHKSTAMDAVIVQLEKEHGEGVALADAFAEAVAAYAAHGLAAAGPLVAAAGAYAPYLRRHMEYENEQLLARVEQVGSPGLLAAALTSFDRFEDTVMGAGTHEQLHRMIDTLGPRLEESLS